MNKQNKKIKFLLILYSLSIVTLLYIRFFEASYNRLTESFLPLLILYSFISIPLFYISTAAATSIGIINNDNIYFLNKNQKLFKIIGVVGVIVVIFIQGSFFLRKMFIVKFWSGYALIYILCGVTLAFAIQYYFNKEGKISND